MEKINEVFLQFCGCPPEAITISFEEFAQEEYTNRVQSEIEAKMGKMWVFMGEKKY